MSYLICSSQLVFPGSADSQIFMINKKHQEQKFLISFVGYLASTSDELDQFRCNEIVLYTGANVQNIIETTMKRSKSDKNTKHHSYRRFPLTPELNQKIVGWMFTADFLSSLD